MRLLCPKSGRIINILIVATIKKKEKKSAGKHRRALYKGINQMLLLPSVKLAHGMSRGVVILHIRTFTLTIWHPNIKRIRHSVTDLVCSIPSWTTTTEL